MTHRTECTTSPATSWCCTPTSSLRPVAMFFWPGSKRTRGHHKAWPTFCTTTTYKVTTTPATEEKEEKEKETKEKRERGEKREKREKKGEKSDGDAEDFNLAEAVLRLVKLQRPQPKDGIGLEVETVALGGKSSGTSGLAITSVTIPPHVIEKLLFYGLPDNEPAEVRPGNLLLAVNGTIACNRPVLHVRGLLDTATLAASAHAAHTKRSGVCI